MEIHPSSEEELDELDELDDFDETDELDEEEVVELEALEVDEVLELELGLEDEELAVFGLGDVLEDEVDEEDTGELVEEEEVDEVEVTVREDVGLRLEVLEVDVVLELDATDDVELLLLAGIVAF